MLENLRWTDMSKCVWITWCQMVSSSDGYFRPAGIFVWRVFLSDWNGVHNGLDETTVPDVLWAQFTQTRVENWLKWFWRGIWLDGLTRYREVLTRKMSPMPTSVAFTYCEAQESARNSWWTDVSKCVWVTASGNKIESKMCDEKICDVIQLKTQFKPSYFLWKQTIYVSKWTNFCFNLKQTTYVSKFKTTFVLN